MTNDISQVSHWNQSYNVWGDLNCNIFMLNSATRSPSMVADIILSIVPHIWNLELKNSPLKNEFKIIEKIDYNGLIKYRGLVLDLWKYISAIEDEFDNLEQKIPWLKARFLDYINGEYRKISNDWSNADKKFESMIDLIIDKFSKSSNKNDKIYLEDIENAAQYIIWRSFIQCKILEAPVPNANWK